MRPVRAEHVLGNGGRQGWATRLGQRRLHRGQTGGAGCEGPAGQAGGVGRAGRGFFKSPFEDLLWKVPAQQTEKEPMGSITIFAAFM